jgi:hypothetical protein
MAINLEPGVAITQNYVSQANLAHVLSFMEPSDGRSDHLVSGCASREDRARLHERFVGALERERPEAMQALRAEQAAKRHKV